MEEILLPEPRDDGSVDTSEPPEPEEETGLFKDEFEPDGVVVAMGAETLLDWACPN